MNIFRIFPVVSLLTLVAGAVLAGNPAAIAVSQPWVRALPPTQANTAAYLVIENQGGAAVTITGASSDIAERVEFHTTREVDGYQRMEQLQQLLLDLPKIPQRFFGDGQSAQSAYPTEKGEIGIRIAVGWENGQFKP